jgi:hypothetical protein
MRSFTLFDPASTICCSLVPKFRLRCQLRWLLCGSVISIPVLRVSSIALCCRLRSVGCVAHCISIRVLVLAALRVFAAFRRSWCFRPLRFWQFFILILTRLIVLAHSGCSFSISSGILPIGRRAMLRCRVCPQNTLAFNVSPVHVRVSLAGIRCACCSSVVLLRFWARVLSFASPLTYRVSFSLSFLAILQSNSHAPHRACSLWLLLLNFERNPSCWSSRNAAMPRLSSIYACIQCIATACSSFAGCNSLCSLLVHRAFAVLG